MDSLFVFSDENPVKFFKSREFIERIIFVIIDLIDGG